MNSSTTLAALITHCRHLQRLAGGAPSASLTRAALAAWQRQKG